MTVLLELERQMKEAQRDARFHSMKMNESIERVAHAFHATAHKLATCRISELAAEIKTLNKD